ncbi:MAG: hypothetical protein HY903_19665 [Deltaproteobacteria bacterium]|nr:hypothetical protein [Deltaproteobacteria bacterium]
MKTTLPRIPHLPGSRRGHDDLTVAPAALRSFLELPVVVVEKMDGIGLTIASDDYGELDVAMKTDWRRALGGRVLRAARRWLRVHRRALAPLAADGQQIYAEWLLHRLVLPYDRLPAAIIFHSLADRSGRLLPRDQANRLFAKHDLAWIAPHFRGVIGRRPLSSLILRRSQLGRCRSEGIIVEATGPDGPCWAKWVAPHYRQPTGKDLAGVENAVLEVLHR